MIGALVMSYGSPQGPNDIERFYTHIRGGVAPTDAQLAGLRARYEAIGGTTALTERSTAQQQAIAHALGAEWVVRPGLKHSPPFIEDGISSLIAAGVDAIVGVVLSPHYSRASVGQYHSRAAAAAGSTCYGRVDRWFDLDAYVGFTAKDLRRAIDAAEPNTKVLFSAHSLPEQVLLDDPYPGELRAGAEMIASRAGLSSWGDWGLVWQSAGATPESWRGPDIGGVLADLADTRRSPGVIVVPHGFTTEHLEVRYDLDISAAATARELGLAFERTAVVDSDPGVMAQLAERITESVP